MNTFDLSLDLSKSRNVNPIRLRQGDLNGTTIRALIFDHGALADLSGTTARWVMRLPGGEEYYRKTATVDATACTVTVEVDETQAASVSGRCRGYFQILDGSTVIASTGDVLVEVLPDALEGATVAESYDSAIQDAIDALDAAVEAIPDTVEDVLEAHPEWTTTVQDGAVTDAKLYQGKGGILARNQRLMHRLDNLLTAALPEGDSATATDAAKTPLAGLALYGRSTQDGTPTPSAPVAIESVAGNILDPAQVFGGVSFYTVNADGSVTVNAEDSRGWSDVPAIALPAGTYSATIDGNAGGRVICHVYVNGVDNAWEIMGNGSKTFTLAADGEAKLKVHQGTFPRTVRIALYADSTPLPYVPYGHAGLWAQGKNLLNIPGWWSTTTAASGITCTVNADGSVATSGTASASSDVIGYGISAGIPIAPLEPGSYVFTGCPANGSTSTYALVLRGVRADGTTKFYVYDTGSGVTVTLAEGEVIDRVHINVKSGVNMDGKVFYPMLRRAGTGADFATYAESVTPIDLDGHELRSLPDGTRDELTVGADGRVTLVQRVGSVDLGTLAWSWQSSWESWYSPYLDLGALNPASIITLPVLMHAALVPIIQQNATVATYEGTGIALAKNPSSDETRIIVKNGSTTTQPTGKMHYALATPQTIDLGWTDAIPLCGPDLTAQAVPSAPFALTYERDLNTTLARLEAALAALA